MKSLTIKTRLVLLVGSLLLLLVVAAFFLVYRMKASNESLGSLYNDRVTALELLKHTGDGYNDIVDIAHKVGAGSMTASVGAAQVKQARDKAATPWKAYLSTDLDAQEMPLTKKAEPLVARADAVIAQLAALLDHGDVAGVRTLADNALYPAIDPLADVVDKLALLQLEGAAAEYHGA